MVTEVQFRLKKVTSSGTQADHVLAAIPDTLFPQMSAWLDVKGDDTVEYNDLKTFILKKFSPSTEKRVQMILDLSNQPLGDPCLSKALTEMGSLCHLPPDADDASANIDVLLALWLQRLPDPAHAAITDFPSFTNNVIATSADGLLNTHTATSRPPLAATASMAPPDVGEPTDDPPDDAIAASSSSQRFPAFNHLRSSAQAPHPHLQKDVSSPPSSIRKSDFASKLCYYHTRFGPAAKKCQQPCDWSKIVL